MRPTIFALSALLMAAASADAQRGRSCPSCGGGSCAVQPDAQPEKIGLPASIGEKPVSGYQWKYVTKDGALLYRDGKQVGGWDATRQRYRELIDFASDIWGPEQASPPTPLPFDLLPVKPADALKIVGDFRTQGVIQSEMCKHERYSVNGSNVAYGDGVKAITAGLDDDSRKLWLSVWSVDPVKRELVIAKLKEQPGAWEHVEKTCHVWAGDAARPDHFLTKDRDGKSLYCFDGDPCVSLQDPDGVEIYRDGGFTDGPEPLMEKIRAADPTYKPDLVPGPHGHEEGHWLFALIVVALLVGAIFFFTRKKDE